MIRKTVLILVLLSGAAFLFAQTAAPGVPDTAILGEPEEIGIIVPDILLEVRDLSIESVDAAIPEGEVNLLPDTVIPLPGIEPISISEDAFQALVPDALTGSAADTGESLFYNSGSIGFGYPSIISGLISIYKLGQDPRFQLDFTHDAIDGFGLHPAGAGYSLVDDRLAGSLTGNSESLRYQIDGEYRETVSGLQAKSSDYQSRSSKLLRSSGSIQNTFFPWLTMGLSASVNHETWLLSGSDPTEQAELFLGPQVEGILSFEGFSFNITLPYEYRNVFSLSDSSRHRFKPSVRATVELPAETLLSLRVGAALVTGMDLLVPFNIDLTGTPAAGFRYRVTGGLSSESVDNKDILPIVPVLAVSDPADAAAWNADGSVSWEQTGWSASAAVSFAYRTQAPDAAIVPDAASGMVSWDVKTLTSLAGSVQLSWDPLPLLHTELSWKGQFLDSQVWIPRHQIAASIALKHAAYGVTLTGREDFYTDPQPFFLGLTGYLQVADGVKLEVRGDDLILPLLGGHRYLPWTYEDTGFRFGAYASLSL